MDAERSVKDAQIARDPVAGVYFLEAVGVGLVKIGCAVDIAARWSDLSTMSPVPLNLVAILPGSRDREQELHTMLAEYRHHGEWFRRCKMLDDIVSAARQNIDIAGIAKRKDRYFRQFLDEILPLPQPRLKQTTSHEWERFDLFRRCVACGYVRLRGDRRRTGACPGVTGNRRIRSAVARLKHQADPV